MDSVGPFSDAISVSEAETGLWKANIAPGWDIMGNTNGGYVLALIANAMRNATQRSDPLSVTGHFLAPAKSGPITVRTGIHKQGRTAATVSATAFSGERPIVSSIGSFGEVVSGGETLVSRGVPPSLPAVEDCFSLSRLPELPDSEPWPPPFMGKVDIWLHPDDAGFATGIPAGEPRMRAWFELPGEEFVDSLALILAADALPPTTFNSGLPLAWTPTLELTVHVRAVPTPGWLRIDSQTYFITDGRLEVDTLIWDSEDHLVAQSRQLQLLPAKVAGK
jgi:acyl-CoA thioesterase